MPFYISHLIPFLVSSLHISPYPSTYPFYSLVSSLYFHISPYPSTYPLYSLVSSPIYPRTLLYIPSTPLYRLYTPIYPRTLLYIPSTPLYRPCTSVYPRTLLHIPSTLLYRLYTPIYPRPPLYIPYTPLYRLYTPIYFRAFYIHSLLLVSFLICPPISWCQSTYTLIALKWTDQHQSVVMNGLTSDPQSISFGVLEGSLIGLLLFIIYIIDLPSVVKQCKILFYSDDTLLLYVGSSSLTDIEFMLYEDLKLIIECGLIITTLEGEGLGKRLGFLRCEDKNCRTVGGKFYSFHDKLLSKNITRRQLDG